MVKLLSSIFNYLFIREVQNRMPKAYLINTNKKNNPYCENDMLDNEKCSAYYTPWKYYIDTIEANDIVFLYSSGKGIVARGLATGIVETGIFEGNQDAEHYMHLNRFEILNDSLPANQIISIIRKVAGDDFDIQWNQTMILLADHFSREVWQYITKKCM